MAEDTGREQEARRSHSLPEAAAVEVRENAGAEEQLGGRISRSALTAGGAANTPARVSATLSMQRGYGNRAVQRFMARSASPAPQEDEPVRRAETEVSTEQADSAGSAAPVQRMVMPDFGGGSLMDLMPSLDDVGGMIGGGADWLGGGVRGLGKLGSAGVRGGHNLLGSAFGIGGDLLGGGITAGSSMLFGEDSAFGQIGGVIGGGVSDIGHILQSGATRNGASRGGVVSRAANNIAGHIGSIGHGIGDFVSGLDEIDPSYLLM
jgi:hypothetical protein